MRQWEAESGRSTVEIRLQLASITLTGFSKALEFGCIGVAFQNDVNHLARPLGILAHCAIDLLQPDRGVDLDSGRRSALQVTLQKPDRIFHSGARTRWRGIQLPTC